MARSVNVSALLLSNLAARRWWLLLSAWKAMVPPVLALSLGSASQSPNRARGDGVGPEREADRSWDTPPSRSVRFRRLRL